jgi:enoyl-CoA hydratase/carnithine racemase
VALLGDYRIGHADSPMGQPEINSGILSITGFWLIREHLGLARATDLVLTGRMVPAKECHAIGILNEIVPRGEVQTHARAIANELASKDAGAYRADKQWICAATQRAFDEAYEAARISHAHAFEGGGPQGVMESFLKR